MDPCAEEALGIDLATVKLIRQFSCRIKYCCKCEPIGYPL